MAGTGPEPVPVVRAVDFGTARLLPDIDRARAWLLTVDEAPQSYVDLDDPAHLEFEYVRRIAYAVQAGFAEGEPLDAVHLGGGAMTLARWLPLERPGSRQHVVEADRGLAALVAEVLPLSDPSVTVDVADARAWLAQAGTASADLVVADVFGGSRVPAALTSVEFVRDALRVLRPGGVYLANVADAAPFAFLRSQLATVRAALADVGADGGASDSAGGGASGGDLCLLAEPGVLRGRRFGNAVLVASRRPLPVEALSRLCAADAFPARVVHGAALARLTGGAHPVDDASATASPRPPEGAFTVG
ncbi:spermidine synthase [Streptomyces sp. NPDC049040]|uniref:spermidine synthase n=1 Tax=Streptomyces sp. NPDC049040 TaxID=3365593 RepID=UPI003713C94F